MSTTINNIHVHFDSGTPYTEIGAGAAEICGSAYLSGNIDGWVSVLPETETFNDPSHAIALSTKFQRPCIDLFCFQSDMAVAALIVDGDVVTRLTAGGGEFFAPPDTGEPNIAIDGTGGGIWFDAEPWTSVFPTADVAALATTLTTDPPTAEDAIAALFTTLAIPTERAITAYRHIDLDPQPEPWTHT